MFDRSQHEQANDELPLIDERVMSEWCGDLGKADVAELLAHVPAEGHKCLGWIKEAASRGDLASAKRVAHRLKGMASNLGAARLASIARQIELASADVADLTARSAALETTLIATLEALRERA